ncbi:MAG: hypothetical protein GQ574_25950 [Crocinitomix sp.]|nr:hypothetical protein [Crocinitomix sp.]
MKQQHALNLLVLLQFSFFTFITTYANVTFNTASIEKLVQEGKVHVQIKGLGGHSEECVSFTLSNRTSDSLFGYVEPGRRLISDNSKEQDILIVKALDFALAANESKTVNGFGFCCQSNNSGPGVESGFSLGKMTDDNWQTLAQKVNEGDYPPSAIQNAVWVLSDGHDIRSIPAFGDVNTQGLRQSVADMLGIEIPWYSFLYAEDSTRIFSGVANRLFAEVVYSVPRRTMMSGQIHDENGNLVYNFKSYHTSKGEHKYNIDVALDNFPEGEYTFTLLEDFGIMNLQKKFRLGEEV